MSRRLRYMPRPMVVEVTCRTIHGRFLLPPSPLLNRLAVGVLARAQRMYGVRMHAFCLMSNHYHLLLTARDALQLARFMNFVQSNLAREAGRLTGWRERFWGRRYQAILVSDEPAAQLGRLRYILSQGCKEGLVHRPEDWTGAQCVRQLMVGETTLKGEWIDRTALYRESRHLRSPEVSAFTREETLTLSPLPCFEGVGADQQRDWIRGCVEQITNEAREERIDHRRDGEPENRARDPERPQPMRRRPAPWFHVATAITGRELRVGYALFLSTYRSAAAKLKRGLDAAFPEGSFPPAPAYISACSWIASPRGP